jgi:hypothetical protein
MHTTAASNAGAAGRDRHPRHERGAALVTGLLLATVLLGGVAGSYVLASAFDASASRTARSEAERDAEAGIRVAIGEMHSGLDSGTDGLGNVTSAAARDRSLLVRRTDLGGDLHRLVATASVKRASKTVEVVVEKKRGPALSWVPRAAITTKSPPDRRAPPEDDANDWNAAGTAILMAADKPAESLPASPDALFGLPPGGLRAAAIASGTYYASQALFEAAVRTKREIPGGCIIYLDFETWAPADLGKTFNAVPSVIVHHDASKPRTAVNPRGMFRGLLVCDSLVLADELMLVGGIVSFAPAGTGNAFWAGNASVRLSSAVLRDLPSPRSSEFVRIQATDGGARP